MRSVVYCLLVTAGFRQLQVQSLRRAVTRNLVPLRDYLMEEWSSPDDSFSSGLFVLTLQDGQAAQRWEPEAVRLIQILREAVIRLGTGSRGLRHLNAALRSAHGEAAQISPSSYEFDQYDLDVDECDGDFDKYALNHDAVSWLADEWLHAILTCLRDLFDLLESGIDDEFFIVWQVVGSPSELEPCLENVAEERFSAAVPFALGRTHYDVTRSITPTNGPNASTRAISSSVCVRGALLAA